jgi:hypothetical protein
MSDDYKPRYGRKEADDIFDGLKEIIEDHKAKKAKPDPAKPDPAKPPVKEIPVPDPAKPDPAKPNLEDKPKKSILDIIFGD